MSLTGDTGGAKIGIALGYCECRILRLLAAFQDIMTPDTYEWMCMSSWCCLPWRWNVTGILSIGCMLWPSAVQEMISDDRRWRGCSLSNWRSCGPVVEMSAPESGRTTVSHEPFAEHIWTPMVGAGSAAKIWVMVSIQCCWRSSDHVICNSLVETGGRGGIPFVQGLKKGASCGQKASCTINCNL